ncbi:MAG TPA: HPP family protein [Edaphobacter sp.]|uniref:HPP family protein n=1 Tax=Edaphobacter sp. TaxID=1934404 RepID=UPI002C3E584E|nr:HPP family protein [Edaphobacter sp.]HUZ96845.1 HPP family protein [Edaphobacter sp.]
MHRSWFGEEEHEAAQHVEEFLRHIGLHWLLRHLPPRIVWGGYVFINSFLTIGLLSLLAGITGSPFVFPSLGPTAYLFFFAPMGKSSSPRHAILGHAIGLVCGYGAYVAMGSHGFAVSSLGEVSWREIMAAALSLAATGAIMVLLRVSHPPAGATTLIVSLGILTKPEYLVIIEIAVILLTAQAWAINRIAGLDYPLWEKKPSPSTV